MIELSAIGQRFGAFTLGELTLRVEQGAYWVLLGPTGAGKSLLLHLIAGLYPLARGRITLAGADVGAVPPERRQLGVVFQSAALFPHLSVRENIAYGLRARRLPRAERDARVDALIERLGIGALRDRPTASLSGGEAQKVAIARALAIRPRLLLLDEPLAAVDHNARLGLQEELRRWHRELGLTTLHVTHSREEALALADHCAVMLGGRLVQHGPTAELFARPRCAFVARFLGVAPVGQSPCAEACFTQPGRCTHPQGEG